MNWSLAWMEMGIVVLMEANRKGSWSFVQLFAAWKIL